MTWWHAWVLFVVAAMVFGYMCDMVIKAIREVRNEVNRLRITMIELDKPPIKRGPYRKTHARLRPAPAGFFVPIVPRETS